MDERANPKPLRPAKNSATTYVERIENLNVGMDKLKSEHTLKCKDVRADIKQVLKEAEGDGFSKAAIKAVVKARALEAKAEAERADLDGVGQTVFDEIRHALGDYADTELGQAAVAAATNGAAEAQATA